ncbi:aminodeoxychorismate synthase component I [Xanthomonadaceae bacterium XH05]|nr:aminodeoxychorismate synthase component I [Xanthomonadaceae bacterium XH05]
MLPVRKIPGQVDPLRLHRQHPARYPFLLQSASFEPSRGRYDVLLAFPQSGLRLDRDGVVRTLEGEVRPGAFPEVLDAEWQVAASGCERETTHLPFHGGWALFFAYEFAGVVEPVLDLPAAPDSLPLALALRCPAAVITDHMDDVTWLVAERGHDDLLDAMQADIRSCSVAFDIPPSIPSVKRVSEDPDAAFIDGVERALAYIASGDVFQINLSRRWDLELAAETTPADVFAALRAANPAPFAGLIAWDDWAVASSSPERLVSVDQGVIETRPIAGTRARLVGDDDAGRIRELIGHPKERAEHIMLIDLERNDLGRICAPGSVEVDELMVVESYAHVHHIVSNVRGRLRPDVTPGGVLRAVFPGGTITGCPKVRCMQIIAELEGQGRGAYTGAFGYLGHDGRMDLNILIRTLTLRNGIARFRAGAGIVADSQPQAELAETRAKARGLLRAFGLSG